MYNPLNCSFSCDDSLRSAVSNCCKIFTAFAASSLLNPSIFTASRIILPASLRDTLDGGLNFTSGVSAGCSAAAADLALDFDRAGGSAGAAGGEAEELRPRAGLLAAGATTISSAGSAFAAEGGRFAMGPAPTLCDGAGVGVGPDATPDELDAAPLVREALLLLALAGAGATAGATAGASAGCLPFNLNFLLALVSAAVAASPCLVAGGGASFSGIGVGFIFGAEFAFRSLAAFKVALIFSPLALRNLPLTFGSAAFSAFLILPLPPDGGGLPFGGGAMPAGVSGGPGCMCKTKFPFPFPLPLPYGVCRVVRAFTVFPDVASCFAPIPDGTDPDGTVPDELAGSPPGELSGTFPVNHLFQPSAYSGCGGSIPVFHTFQSFTYAVAAGVVCLTKVSTYEGLAELMWDGPRWLVNTPTTSICFCLRLCAYSISSLSVSLLASITVSPIVKSNTSGFICCVVPVLALGPFEPSGGGP